MPTIAELSFEAGKREGYKTALTEMLKRFVDIDVTIIMLEKIAKDFKAEMRLELETLENKKEE